MFNKLILNRYSVRNYLNTPVEESKLLQVMEAARLAPSAANYQPWHFIVVRKPENLVQLHQAYHREWFKTAPLVIIGCADHSVSWKRGLDGKNSADIDVAIAIDHITLQATDLGLGTCWICNFNSSLIIEFLKLPPHIEPIALIPLGYPADGNIPVKKRKNLKEIIHWEKFQDFPGSEIS